MQYGDGRRASPVAEGSSQQRIGDAANMFRSHAGSLDSLQAEAYDDASYDSVETLHHTDRENRAMAPVFSILAASFYSFSDPHDQLTQSRHACHGFHSPHPFMEPRQVTPIGP